METTIQPDPLDNMGSVVYARDPQVGIGWLTLVFSAKKWGNKKSLVETLLYVYTRNFLDNVTHSEVKANTYKSGYRTVNGTMLLYDHTRDDVCLSISQTAIEKLNLADFVAFCWDVAQAGGSVSRFDIYIDDFVGWLDVAVVRSAINSGWYVGRAKTIGSVGKIAAKTLDSTGDTVYIGTRQSEAFLRFYDKALQKKVDFVWNRVELETKGHFAKQAFKLFLDAASLDWLNDEKIHTINATATTNTLRGLILSKCDFRYADSHNNVSKRQRCEFWEKIIMNVADIETMKFESHTDIERLKEWFEGAVAPSLSVLLDYHGDEAEQWLRDMVVIGRERRRARHTEMLLKAGK